MLLKDLSNFNLEAKNLTDLMKYQSLIISLFHGKDALYYLCDIQDQFVIQRCDESVTQSQSYNNALLHRSPLTFD